MSAITKDQIIAGNELIANSSFCSQIVKNYIEKLKAEQKEKFSYLAINYHTSFDMLNPIMDEIQKIQSEDKYVNCFDISFSRDIRETTVFLALVENGTKKIISCEHPSRITAIWQVIVEFIKYYKNK